jgi:hypothetical protein
MLSVNAAVVVCEGLLESVTCTVMLLEPAVVGVPLITPVVDESDKPAGNVPEASDHVYGWVPFVAVTVALYAFFTEPLGRDVVVIVRAEYTVKLKDLVKVCGVASASLTLA